MNPLSTTAMSPGQLETCRALANSEGDGIYTRIDIDYSWLDRLRLAFGRRSTVFVRIPTLHPIVGHGQAEVTVHTAPLWRKRHQDLASPVLTNGSVDMILTGTEDGEGPIITFASKLFRRWNSRRNRR